MPLVSMREVLNDALAGRYAVGAFNANNTEMILETIAAAEAQHSPVIIQISPGAIKYATLEMAADMVRGAAIRAKVPVVLHLDHGQDYAVNEACAKASFTGLMYDGSEILVHDWEKAHPASNPTFEILVECVQSQEALRLNIQETKRVVAMAASFDIPVEAEIGHIPRIERLFSKEEQLQLRQMSPAQAIDFIRENVGEWLKALWPIPAKSRDLSRKPAVIRWPRRSARFMECTMIFGH